MTLQQFRVICTAWANAYDSDRQYLVEPTPVIALGTDVFDRWQAWQQETDVLWAGFCRSMVITDEDELKEAQRQHKAISDSLLRARSKIWQRENDERVRAQVRAEIKAELGLSK